MGPLLGICPRPPGSLPAGLTLESEPSHLRPETAAAHLVHIPRTVYGAPSGPCKGPPTPPVSRAPVPPSPYPCVPRSAQPWRCPRGLGTASWVPGVERGSPDRVLEVPELASKAASWVPLSFKPAFSLSFFTFIKRLFSSSSLGRSPGEGNGNPLWYSCLENSMD